MDVHAILAYAKAVAISPVGAFRLAVALDDLLGIALAVKGKTFDVRKLGSFLVSQFGTKAAVALGGMVVLSVLSQSSSVSGLKDAVVAATVAGSLALAAGVIADARDKAVALFK